jgi:hypothetical protein
MSKWRRWSLVGVLVLVAVCLIAVALIGGSVVGSFQQAQQRWLEKGSPNYTLIVSEACFCPYYGDLRITVKQGVVVDAEQVPDPVTGEIPNTGFTITPANLASMSRLTVTSMLAVAGRDQLDFALSPWFKMRSVQYDPTYGYVTSYTSDENGTISMILGQMVMDSGYAYSAHDLQLIEP